MEHNRLGVMGHYYGGMLRYLFGPDATVRLFGGHIEMLEVDELADLRGRGLQRGNPAFASSIFSGTSTCNRTVSPGRIGARRPHLRRAGSSGGGSQAGSLAYYYKGEETMENEDTISSIILGTSLLTARGIPVAGECEIKNAQAMKIMDCFGAGGSFTEYYAVDFNDDVILMGHDGPGHIAIAQGRTKVRPTERVSRQSRQRAIRGDVRQAWSRNVALRRSNG